MISFLVVLLHALCQSLETIALTDLAGPSSFNLTYTGVVFGPYVKNRLSDGSTPNWKSYSEEELSALLKLTSTKFKHITTYGMGVGDPNGHWRHGDRAGLVPFLSAVHNSNNTNRKLSVSIGVWHNQDPKLYQREVFNAFETAKEANAQYENTVWGIALSSLTYLGHSNGQILQFLETNRPQARQNRLQIGVRIEFCNQIIPTQLPEQEYIQGLHSAVPLSPEDQPLSDIQRIARAADFVICINQPPANLVSQGVEVAAESLMAELTLIEKLMKKENEVIHLWFETGWPSAGISQSGSKNSGRNLRTYWNLMSQLGAKSKIHLYMFAAFDEPWKISLNKNITDPRGPNGAESHYGWWRLLDNNDFSKFEEKVAEPEEFKEFSLPGGAVAGIVIAVLTPVIVFLVWRLYKARKTIERISEKDIKDFMEGMAGSGKGDSVDVALQVPYDRSYELSKADFVIDESDILGSGAFGVVHKGKITGIDGIVAFKRPNKDISVAQLKNLLSEIKIMIYIGRHENIVVLLGAYTEQIREGVVYIASECCSLGSLESHLRSIPRTFTTVAYENITKTQPNSSDPYENMTKTQPNSRDVRYVNCDRKPVEISTTVPTLSLYKWSFQIASGMEYLASKRVVHADLATRNVLLTENGTAKISDFGLSRRLYEYTQYVKCSQEPLPWRWMAIESLRSLAFSTESDVWSFGVTVWEIFSLGDMPYPGLSWDITFVEQLERGLRMQLPKYATNPIYEQMTRCWNIDPKARPSFTELKAFFELLTFEEQKLNC